MVDHRSSLRLAPALAAFAVLGCIQTQQDDTDTDTDTAHATAATTTEETAGPGSDEAQTSESTDGTSDGDAGESSTSTSAASSTSTTSGGTLEGDSPGTGIATDESTSTSTSSSATGTGGDDAESSASGTTDGQEPFEGKELFILFGQSNMSGMSPMPSDPWPIDERVTFMVQYDCPRLDQTKDEWLPAEPPLHGCQWATNGIGLGLADHFGAAMAEAWPDAEIGLIPNAIPATTIEIFMKDGPSPGGGMRALPDGYTSAYALMVDRVREAQQIGRVRGILLHQGESDFNQGFADEWLGRLSMIVADLREDLDLGEDVPFLAGEISPASQYSGINVNINEVPNVIPNSAVVSAEGTDIHDIAHFDAASARVMGERYAEKFLELEAQ